MKLQQYVAIEISSLKFQILTLRNIYCFRKFFENNMNFKTLM